jgi:diadenosine tetraphosphatase ApaH/serine/threonine PP2A family protein phosphatase
MAGDKYAILGDIHSNWHALNAVLADAAAQGVTHFACVGDIVGYNANPRECIDKVREIGCVAVRGNHDHYCSHDECLRDFHPLAANVVDWTRSQLSADQSEYLRSLKLSRIQEGFTIVHSTLDMPEKWGYVFDELAAEPHFHYQATAVCFHGHTHVPVVFEKAGRVHRGAFTVVKVVLGKKYFVNVGSVGQPRDGDPRSAYAIFDTGQKVIELRRIPYDIAAAQKQILAAGLPERLAVRLSLGK